MGIPTDERGQERISIIGKVHCHCCGAESKESGFFAGALEAANEPNSFASAMAIAQALQPALPCQCATKGHCYKCNRCGEHCECDFVHGPKAAYFLTHDRPAQRRIVLLDGKFDKEWSDATIAAAEWMDALCQDGIPFQDREPKLVSAVFEVVIKLLYGPDVFDIYNDLIDL